MDVETIYTVSDLTDQIKDILEGSLSTVSVQGEISNFHPAASGHIYFSLKDGEASIAVVLFKGSLGRGTHPSLKMKNGLEVICHGRVSVYAPRGSYQIIAKSIEPVGEGNLQIQFENLKKKLQAEGLFAEERKRPLPEYLEKLVVITSPTGAAIRDVLAVLKRRHSGVEVMIIPSLVQGESAEKQLVEAIGIANKHKLGDVILLTRGGGSLEDLWCFNSEKLARAIVASDIPVVSAVGHEVDFTIADFVADKRAPTPSTAAEILVKERVRLLEELDDLNQRLVHHATLILKHWQMELDTHISRLKNPKDRVHELRQLFDDWMERLQVSFLHEIQRKSKQVKEIEARLGDLSPLRVLSRGYSLVLKKDGSVVMDSSQVQRGEDIRLRLAKGELGAQVTSD